MRIMLPATIVSLVLAGAVHSAGAGRARPALTCTRRIYVTFFVYSTFPAPKNTRCWSYERPPQALGHWHICHWDKQTNGTGKDWIYDDTSAGHRPLSSERSKVASCAAGGGPLGYEAMARRNGTWRRVTPPGVAITRFYAETYSTERAVDDQFPAWLAHRTVGQPIVNIGPATSSKTYAAVYRACRAIQPSGYIGVYSGSPVTAANGKLEQVQNALNACTTR